MYNFETYVLWLFFAIIFASCKSIFLNFPKGHIPPIRNLYFDFIEEDETSQLRRSERLTGKNYNYKI